MEAIWRRNIGSEISGRELSGRTLSGLYACINENKRHHYKPKLYLEAVHKLTSDPIYRNWLCCGSHVGFHRADNIIVVHM